mmetsp:Transcript_12945/g.36397  ORF Transcript_12945/g.36397 Transcript_12945/m.36397 type:complete len:106 (-) Transcript_12945:831-1148(-)
MVCPPCLPKELLHEARWAHANTVLFPKLSPTSPSPFLPLQKVGRWAERPHSFESSIQLFSTISFTRLLYSRLFSLYSLAASELAGEFGLGSHNSDWIEVKIAETS